MTTADITNLGATSLMERFGNSVKAVIMDTYPDYPWDPTLFYNPSFQKQLVEIVGKKYGVKNPDDWYTVPKSKFLEGGGVDILKFFGHSLTQALIKLFDEHTWVMWKFPEIPAGWLENPANLKETMDALNKLFNITRPEQWYDVSNQEITNQEGGPLLAYFNNCLYTLLSTQNPGFPWKKWMFFTAPESLFEDSMQLRQCCEWLASKLDVKTPDGWYAVTNSEFVIHRGGSALLHHYGSVGGVLASVYPEYKWQMWHFQQVPEDVLEEEVTQTQSIEWLAGQLNVKEPVVEMNAASNI